MSTALFWCLISRQSDHVSVAFSSTPQLLHTLSRFSKPSLVHGHPPAGQDSSYRHLLSFMWTSLGSNRTGFTLTAAYFAVILTRFCFAAVKSRRALLCFLRHLADSRACVDVSVDADVYFSTISVPPHSRVNMSLGNCQLIPGYFRTWRPQ